MKFLLCYFLILCLVFSVVHKVCIHSRSESASSVGSLGAVHDASLKKLMKDLHRCEVSISRYQAMLNEVKRIRSWIH